MGNKFTDKSVAACEGLSRWEQMSMASILLHFRSELLRGQWENSCLRPPQLRIIVSCSGINWLYIGSPLSYAFLHKFGN